MHDAHWPVVGGAVIKHFAKIVRRSQAVSRFDDDDWSLLLGLDRHGIFIQQPPDQGVRRPGALRQATRPAFLAIDFSDHGAREEKDNQVEGPEIAPSQLRSEEHTSELQSLMRSSYAV